MLAAWLWRSSGSGRRWRWSDIGHEIICEIGFQELEPTVRERVKPMIRRDPELDTFAAACSWPDRSRRRAVEHYVNLDIPTRRGIACCTAGVQTRFSATGI